MFGWLINNGVKSDMNFRERRLIQILNVTSFLSGVAILYLAIVHLTGSILSNAVGNALVGSVLILNFIWIRIGKPIIAKIVLIYGVLFTPFYNLYLHGTIPAGQYFSLMVVGFVFMILGSLVFSRRREKFLFYFTIVFYLFWIYFSDRLFYNLSEVKPNVDFINNYYPFYKLPTFFAAIVITLSISVFKNIIFLYETENEQFREELNAMNEELMQQNESLEQNVQDRTRKLTAITAKIYNLANITSHKIRGPVATIMGVTNLFKEGLDDDEVKNIIPKLHQECEDLDMVIKEMAENLEQTEHPWESNLVENEDPKPSDE